MNLLVLSSSLNSESYSRLLAREAERVLTADGHTVVFLDLRDVPLPICDGEKAKEHENARRVSGLVEEADGIVVATAIYNYDANAALKNVIELTGDGWEKKVVSFLCAAGGMSSYMSIMAVANSLMLDCRSLIVPRFVYATGAAFAGERIVDDKVIARVAECARATAYLADAVKRMP